MLSPKHRKRLLTVGLNVINNLAVPFFNAAISFLVIRLNSEETWGAFVAVMIVVQFGAHLASWGNKEYLLREFSRHPDQIGDNWRSSLVTRLLFGLGLGTILLLFGYSPQRFALALLWGIGIIIVQSFEVLVIYRKAFLFDTITKASAIAGMVLILLFSGSTITPDGILTLFAISYAVQSIIYTAYFRHSVFSGRTTIQTEYFRLAFPFFLLGFSGLLASRIDLYAISFFLEDTDVGRYQVFINLMIYLQAVSNFIMVPFVKNLYRLQDATIYKISSRLMLFGVIFVTPSVLAIHWLLLNIYHLDFTLAFALFGGLFALPIYAYIPLIHRLYKNDQQTIVLWVNLGGAGANLLLNMILLPQIGLIGAIISSAVVQWGMLALYLTQSRGVHVDLVPDMPSSN